MVRPPLSIGYCPDVRASCRNSLAWRLTASNRSASSSPASCRLFIRALRIAPVEASAISSSRSANHSTSGCSMWSHGGFPITASNPPLGLASCHPCHTPGNATCQCRNRSRSAIARASSQVCEKPESRSDDSPLASSTYASSGRLPSAWTSGYSNVACSLFFMPEVIQRKPHRKSSSPLTSAIVSSTPLNSDADSCTSDMSASDISSMRCIPAVAASAPAIAELANSPPSRFSSAVASVTLSPTRESRKRRVMVQERQRRAHREAVQPQRHLRKLHRQRILVHAVECTASAPSAG